ncbi:hypothetical protein OG625_15525 [Streptomyces sp. NBC_01351]|nr:hypothetical protein [Streptomyces sp. NBC_01351]
MRILVTGGAGVIGSGFVRNRLGTDFATVAGHPGHTLATVHVKADPAVRG